MKRNEKQTDGTTRNELGAGEEGRMGPIRNTERVGPISTTEKRRGTENSAPLARGSLASPKPSGGGKPVERGDEVHTTERRASTAKNR